MIIQRREELRYASVLLNGPKEVLTRFAIELRKASFQVGRPNEHVLCIDNVSHEELAHIQAEAGTRGCYVESTRGTHLVEVEPKIKKAEKTSIEAGTWYFAENLEDSHPFIYVRSKKKQAMDRMGLSPEEVVVLQLELLDGDGSTPKKFQADARRVADFGLRIATEEDFEERDLPVPAELRMQRQKRQEEHEAATQPDTTRLANFKEA